MRLSRSRVLLRVALLGIGGLVLLARGLQLARASDPSAARIGLVQLVVAALALVTAAGTAASLRRRPRAPTFRLHGREPVPHAQARTGFEEVSMDRIPPGIVDGATAQRLADEGAVVVDVRTPAEFSTGHVAGARNIPFDQVGRRAAEIGPTSTPVVVYCVAGQRSAAARRELLRLGYDKVWDAQRYDAWPKR